jgi:hypothetical protein
LLFYAGAVSPRSACASSASPFGFLVLIRSAALIALTSHRRGHQHNDPVAPDERLVAGLSYYLGHRPLPLCLRYRYDLRVSLT